ncbi:MAG TPA: uroporphyrinogen-III C-methyltransferase [Gammaproteobacteria bacterium]|nr:uroporphyrinogen-III C-methyltransferase [Gammaproteobacteria bacterium]
MQEMQENIPQSEEVVAEPDATPALPPAPPKPNRSPLSILIAVIALLIALASVGAWIYSWWQYQARETKSHEKILQLEKLTKKNQSALSALQTALKNTQQSVQQLNTELEQQNKPKNWLLAAVDNQVKLAALNLRIDNNVTLAQKLLQDADQQLAAANNSALLPVRQALAKDMAALAAAPEVDIPGIIVRLNILKEWVEQFPQTPKIEVKAQPQSNQTLPNTAASQSLSDKSKDFLSRLWQSLKELVVIRHEGAEVAPLLPPNAFAFVVTNIQTQLTLAQWAALHHEEQIYKQSIAQARNWIGRYFAPDDAKVKTAQILLNNLMAVNVNPAIPDLSQSLQAIQKLLVSGVQ